MAMRVASLARAPLLRTSSVRLRRAAARAPARANCFAAQLVSEAGTQKERRSRADRASGLTSEPPTKEPSKAAPSPPALLQWFAELAEAVQRLAGPTAVVFLSLLVRPGARRNTLRGCVAAAGRGLCARDTREEDSLRS